MFFMFVCLSPRQLGVCVVLARTPFHLSRVRVCSLGLREFVCMKEAFQSYPPQIATSIVAHPAKPLAYWGTAPLMQRDTPNYRGSPKVQDLVCHDTGLSRGVARHTQRKTRRHRWGPESVQVSDDLPACVPSDALAAAPWLAAASSATATAPVAVVPAAPAGGTA